MFLKIYTHIKNNCIAECVTSKASRSLKLTSEERRANFFVFVKRVKHIRQLFLILTWNLFLPAGPWLLLLHIVFLNFNIYT